MRDVMDSKLSMEHMIEQATRFCAGVPQEDKSKVWCSFSKALNTPMRSKNILKIGQRRKKKIKSFIIIFPN